jgi:cytochrome c biogenesis protein CcmG, thiol:disulfide interchange protein DsbE
MSARYRIRTTLTTCVVFLLSGTAVALNIGDKLPPITLPTATANTSLTESKAGIVRYVDFWASWCGPCKQSFPWMNAMHDKYASRGLEIVAINVDARRADAERFLLQLPVKFTVAFDSKGDAAKLFSVSAMPSSYLIDSNGEVMLIHSGFREGDRAALENAIISALTQARK